MSKINKKSFKLSDQLFFAQRLSLLLNSGISIIEALSMMKNIDSSVHRKDIYELFIKEIQQGVSLSRSIKNKNIRFHNILITLIQNGESSGHLSEALMQAYYYLEKKNEMLKKIISSLIYPAFIVIATICMTLFLILYIFPKIIPLLRSLNIELPMITRIVQAIYYFSISNGIWIVVGVIVTYLFSIFLIKKSVYFKCKFHKLIISIPIANKYIKIYLVSSICSMGEMLLNSGKGLPEMLKFSTESSKNIIYKNVFNEIYLESVKGVSLNSSIRKYKNIFPPLLADMCEIGEKTGNLAQMFGHCSRIFEQDLDIFLKKFSSLIEPILMVLMGLIVGSIALSIILPIYEITNHLNK